MTASGHSPNFFRDYAGRYAQVSGEFLQSVCINSSHPQLEHDWDLWHRLMELAIGRSGLDAGCGAGARDVFHAYSHGYDVIGIDAIDENIQAAQESPSRDCDRVFVADLANVLPFDDAYFDFAASNVSI